MARNDEPKAEGEAAVVEAADGPLLDLTDAAVKRMIKIAKKRGWVTQEELNAVLPSEEISSDQIEDMNSMLSEMGINVVDSEDAEEAEKEPAETPDEEEAEGGELVEAPRTTAVATRTSEPVERTDDPVRMYLREMGSVELLSREGEIAIAKRIEAGREAMIAGLCESPLTFQAIIIWRDELNDAKILLRDIIDLEATYAGPDGKKTPKVDMTAPGAAEALAGANPRTHRALHRAADAARGLRRRSARRARRVRRRRRSGELRLALRDGGRAQAQGAGDLRPRRRRLQEAAPAAGPERREQAARTRRCRRPRSASTRR